MIKKILVPVDGSENSNRAVDTAAEIASRLGIEMALVHVLLHGHVPEDIRALSGKPGKEMPAMAMGAAHVDASLPQEVLEDIGDKILERSLERAREQGAQAVNAGRHAGDAATVILDQAHKQGADMIVMGSRGLGSLKGLVVGSVSQKVQHLFNGNVLTVK